MQKLSFIFQAKRHILCWEQGDRFSPLEQIKPRIRDAKFSMIEKVWL